MAFIEGWPYLRGGLYEGFHCIIPYTSSILLICAKYNTNGYVDTLHMSMPSYWNHYNYTGFLSAVGSLMMTVQNSTISLTWTAPFTLDIPGDPDITYCVGVVNSTSSSTLHSQCGITETGFSFSIPPDSACHNYTFTFTVTPVNGVGNGISSTYSHLQGDCIEYVYEIDNVFTVVYTL